MLKTGGGATHVYRVLLCQWIQVDLLCAPHTVRLHGAAQALGRGTGLRRLAGLLEVAEGAEGVHLGGPQSGQVEREDVDVTGEVSLFSLPLILNMTMEKGRTGRTWSSR